MNSHCFPLLHAGMSHWKDNEKHFGCLDNRGGMPAFSSQSHSSVCERHRVKGEAFRARTLITNLDFQPQTTEEESLATGIHIPPFGASVTP